MLCKAVVVVFFFFFVVSVKVKVVTDGEGVGKKEEVGVVRVTSGVVVGTKEVVGKSMSKVVKVEVGKVVGKVTLVVTLLIFIIYQAKSLVFIITKNNENRIMHFNHWRGIQGESEMDNC